MRLGIFRSGPRPGTAGRVADIVDKYIGGLPPHNPEDAGAVLVRGWTLASRPADGTLRVSSTVTSAGVVDLALAYDQLVGISTALTNEGFAVAGVLEGWRTVALDVRTGPAAKEPAVAETDAVKEHDAVGEPDAVAEPDAVKEPEPLEAPEAVEVPKETAPVS